MGADDVGTGPRLGESFAEQIGESPPSLLSGVRPAIETAAFAVGVFTLGVILDLLGFVPSTGRPTVLPSGVLARVRIGMALIPAVGVVLSMILIARWMPAAKSLRPYGKKLGPR